MVLLCSEQDLPSMMTKFQKPLSNLNIKSFNQRIVLSSDIKMALVEPHINHKLSYQTYVFNLNKVTESVHITKFKKMVFAYLTCI